MQKERERERGHRERRRPGGHEAAAARGGERRRADAGAGRWEMGRAAEAGSEIGTEKETAVGKKAS
jgi:hypothetical protein